VTPKKASGDALTDTQIIEAARSIIAEVGVEGLTMRKLSDHLGVALGATYHHVSTKHDLLVLVGISLYDGVSYPESDTDDWAGWIKHVVLQLADVVSAFPGLAGYLIEHLDEAMPLELNLRMGTMLATAGFSDRSLNAVMGALTFLISGACAAGVPSRPTPALAAIATPQMLEDMVDVVLAGARQLLQADAAAARLEGP
jgi:TetR/AcrR family tetracycline transcriptional repressor